MKLSRQAIWTTTPWQVFALTAVGLPVLGVVLARELLPSRGPKVAQASSDNSKQATSVPAPLPKDQGVLDAKDVVLLQTLDSLALQQFGPSPIAQARGTERRTTTNRQGQQAATRVASAQFVGQLTSIIKAGDRTSAMIADRVRRPGDNLGLGWTLLSINADEGTASVQHESGLLEVLQLRDRKDTDQAPAPARRPRGS